MHRTHQAFGIAHGLFGFVKVFLYSIMEMILHRTERACKSEMWGNKDYYQFQFCQNLSLSVISYCQQYTIQIVDTSKK
jgi:hypothetical protein